MKTPVRAAMLGACAVIALAGRGAAQDDPVFDGPAPSEAIGGLIDTRVTAPLDEQNIDVNNQLLDALRAARQRGPILQLSSPTIDISFQAGGLGTASLKIVNAGDQLAEIHGARLLGQVDGLDLVNQCPEVLQLGDECLLKFEAQSDHPGVSQTALVIAVNEKERSAIEVPVRVEVTAPPAPMPEPEPEPMPEPSPSPTPIYVQPAPTAPTGPTPEEIARRYFGTVGGRPSGVSAGSRGFTVISRPKEERPTVGGASAGALNVETITQDPRYDESIPSTTASLPVDRARIITADRVIKAVLETPVSNIMCGKVVATVESDVFSATSAEPLIPAGSRVTGKCGSFVDERVAIDWDRIITTDGRSIQFKEVLAGTSDEGGLGGALGAIHQRNRDKFWLPILSTAIDAVAGLVTVNYGQDTDMVVDENGNVIQQQSAKNEGVKIISESIQSTGNQVIGEIRDTRRVAIVPAGSRIDINIGEDIYFKNDREVVRLADMIYNVPDQQPADVTRDPQPSVALAPWTESAEGPVVVVNGKRYVVKDVPPAVDEDGNPLLPGVVPSSEAATDAGPSQGPGSTIVPVGSSGNFGGAGGSPGGGAPQSVESTMQTISPSVGPGASSAGSVPMAPPSAYGQ